MHYLIWLLHISAWLLFTVFGFIGYPLARYLHIGESVYGNSKDGYCGDQPYKDKEARAWFRKLFPCFWWSVIRNPANNFARNTPKGMIIKKYTKHNITTAILHTEDNKRVKVWFVFTPHWPLTFKLGYKVWPSYKFGDIIQPKLALSVQRSL